MKNIVFLLVLITSQVFFFQKALAASAEELLEADILAIVKIMPKSISIYHYFNAPTVNTATGTALHPQLSSQPSRDNWVNWVVSLRAGAFWDMNFTANQYVNAGAGMYLAIDPDSSKEFGNSAVVLKVPNGAYYISVFRPFTIKAETQNALVSEGIISQAQLSSGNSTLGLRAGFSRFTLKNMLLPENRSFRALVQKILGRNHIELIEYEYKSYLAGFCRVANQAAFVFIGAPPDNSSQSQVAAHIDSDYQNSLLISTYAVEGRSSLESQRADLISRFRDALAQIRIYGTGSAKKLISDRMSDSEIDDMVAESYQCTRRQ